MPNKVDMTIDDARELVADQALWPLVRDFLWDFAPQVHSSWLEGLGLPDGLGSLERLEQLERNPRVKRLILETLGVEPCFHVFPKDCWSRLLLLDGPTLASVVEWLGALACAGGLRRVTGGAAVRELKAALPGVYPEVFRFTEYFKGMEESLLGDASAQRGKDRDAGGRRPAAEDVVSAGLSIFHRFFATLPSPVVARLKFKLPKAWDAMALPGGESGGPGGSGSSAMQKLLRLKFPEAYRLCC